MVAAACSHYAPMMESTEIYNGTPATRSCSVETLWDPGAGQYGLPRLRQERPLMAILSIRQSR
jgi:hypothetical protein